MWQSNMTGQEYGYMFIEIVRGKNQSWCLIWVCLRIVYIILPIKKNVGGIQHLQTHPSNTGGWNMFYEWESIWVDFTYIDKINLS
jgi:hypothetical protein